MYNENYGFAHPNPLSRHILIQCRQSVNRDIIAARVYGMVSDQHAAELLLEVQLVERLAPEQTTLHSGTGSALKEATLERLGVLTSYNRPSVSDDNPYVESLFHTIKGPCRASKEAFRVVSRGSTMGRQLRALVQP